MRLLPLGLAAGLAGCAGLSSTLPSPGPPVSFVGVTGAALPAGALEPELQRVQGELQARLMGREWTVPIQLARTAEGAIRIRLGADESFDAGSAELAPEALLLYAEIGEVLKNAPALVTHILVHGDAPAEEAATDLTARRAASVQSYLLARGVRGTRLREEGRARAEPLTPETAAGSINRRVELVLKPVIEGHGAEAWVAPASPRCETCSGS